MSAPAQYTVTDADFVFLKDYLFTRSGLALTPEKRYLLETRLGPICRKRNLASISGLVSALRSAPLELEQLVVEAMTTNETLFFRDKTPFDLLTNTYLPKLVAERGAGEKKLRLWCAAASTGQEPYSLAMLFDGLASTILKDWKIEIIATDISVECLDKAKSGVYNQFEVQRGLPIQLLTKYFKQEGEGWKIAPYLRSMLDFRPLNLIKDFSRLGNFDLIFCRNVLIYFDDATKRSILDRMAKQMSPQGALVLGASETVLGVCDTLVPDMAQRGFYVAGNRKSAVLPTPSAAPTIKSSTMVAAGSGYAGIAQAGGQSSLNSQSSLASAAARLNSLAKPASPSTSSAFGAKHTG
jgi:chemotaxis protein methyltransferase CheR